MIADINGIRIDITVNGAPDAPVMVVHHGGPGVSSSARTAQAWSPFADMVRVVTYDARGSGHSQLVGPYSHEQWAADVDAVRQHLGVDEIIMCGHSYGGFIALEYVLRHPDHVAALILEDTAARSGFDGAIANATDSPRVDIDLATLERVMEGRCRSDDDLRDAFIAMLPLYDNDPTPESVAAAAVASVFHAETHNWAFSRNQPAYNLMSQLESIQCPTLVNVGRHDWITPVMAAEEIAGGISGAELVIYESSGHSPQNEEPEQFQELVRRFLIKHGLDAVAAH